MKYTVMILQDNEYVQLECATLEEAQQVRQSFVNYGKCQEVVIKRYFEVEEATNYDFYAPA